MRQLDFSAVLALTHAHVGEALTREAATALAASVMDLVLGQPLDIARLPMVRSGNYTLQPERLSSVLADMQHLYAAHWQETEHHRHSLPMRPDYARVMQAEACGEYLLLTVRRDGLLAGNCGLWLSRSTHTQTTVAHEDTVYIAPEHRRGRLFAHLAEYVDQAARTFGAAEIRMTTKLTNGVGKMLPRLGYTHAANLYVKVLAGGEHVR